MLAQGNWTPSTSHGGAAGGAAGGENIFYIRNHEHIQKINFYAQIRCFLGGFLCLSFAGILNGYVKL